MEYYSNIELKFPMTFFQDFTQRTIHFISHALYVLKDYALIQRLFSANHRVLDEAKAPIVPPSSPTSVALEEGVPVKFTSETEKKVEFFSRVTVMLIATRQELEDAEVKNDLWWQPADYAGFKNEAAAEVKHCVQEEENNGRTITGRQALSMLYQPEREWESEPSSALSGPSF